MSDKQPATVPRRALLAGASGLVGRQLLALLLQSPLYAGVEALVRRRLPDLPPSSKLRLHEVHFDRLAAVPPSDDVFIALGTTIRAAASQQAFRRVDFDAVVDTARAAREAGAQRVFVVSALGADAASPVFYNRVKGEMQQAVSALGYETVVFAQPSLLLGDRAGLGQPARPAEQWTARLLGPVLPLLPRRIRPISAEQVARSLLVAAERAPHGLHILSSAAMQG